MDDSVLNYEIVLENTQKVIDQTIENYLRQVATIPINTSKLCCDCEEQIDEQRLSVLPQALRCIDCATEFESTRKFHKQVRTTRGFIRNMSP